MNKPQTKRKAGRPKGSTSAAPTSDIGVRIRKTHKAAFQRKHPAENRRKAVERWIERTCGPIGCI